MRGKVIRSYGCCGMALALAAGELLFVAQMPVQSQIAGKPKVIVSPNAFGSEKSVFQNGAFFDVTNPFFQNIGTNGRTCITCHVPSEGWTITPARVQARFNGTKGLDPIFRPVDGTNRPDADLTTLEKRRSASSMLLTKGLIRIGMAIPANAEFTLADVDDPYGFASANELSLFRRPLPTTNLRFLTGVMWDGRESTPLTGTLSFSGTSPDTLNAANLFLDLKHQSNDATTGHAQSIRDLTDEEQSRIANFELSVASAQQTDFGVGALNGSGAMGGVENLIAQNFYVSINDVLGADHFGLPFDSSAMTLYTSWLNSADPKRAQTARGEVLFNTKPIAITGVAGLNDDLKLPVINGFCTTCHDTPNVGNHSVPLPINIGLTDAVRRTPDMPLYTLRNKTTGEEIETTDPGRAMITGKWKDIGKFKGPILRNLAGRAPYFHNGFAASLEDAVNFYDTRFNIGLKDQEKADLVAFLKTL